MKIPIQIVELQQPRCALRFGVAPCPAVGAPKCYNTYATCQSPATRAVYDGSGMIRWRFVANRPGLFAWGDFADPDNQATHGIPVENLSVSAQKSQLNVGGLISGKSPFGIRATCTISMDDFVWNDRFGDFYLGTRSSLPKRTFWTTFLARVKLFSNIRILIYEGYEGDALSAMRQRLYLLDSIDGPANGKVTLSGIDPLMLANNDRAKFPPVSTMVLAEDALAGAKQMIISADASSELSATVGIGSRRFIKIGSEVVEYTTLSTTSGGMYKITGLTRGFGGTQAADQKAGTALNRVGYFSGAGLGDIALYLTQSWTQIADDLIDLTGWAAEAATWLHIHIPETWVTEVTGVEDLLGEICQQAPMYIWWDEYARQVRMRALRPETNSVPILTDATAILADSAVLSRDPDSRVTRVYVYYGPIDRCCPWAWCRFWRRWSPAMFR